MDGCNTSRPIEGDLDAYDATVPDPDHAACMLAGCRESGDCTDECKHFKWTATPEEWEQSRRPAGGRLLTGRPWTGARATQSEENSDGV